MDRDDRCVLACMKHGRLLFSILSLAFLATTAACAPSGSASPAAGAPSSVVALEDTDWKLTEIGGRALMASPKERPPWMRLVSDGKRVHGSGGCNRMSGSYTVDGANLRFGPIISTKMACEGGMEHEQAFFDALSRTTSYRIEGKHLFLSGPDGLLARLESQLV
jgi:heat shock protein HslJ